MFGGMRVGTGLQRSLDLDDKVELEFTTRYDLSNCEIGCFIAVDGVKLEIIDLHRASNNEYVVVCGGSPAVLPESDWGAGKTSFVERSLRTGDPVDGHIFSGVPETKAFPTEQPKPDNGRIFRFGLVPDEPHRILHKLAEGAPISLSGLSFIVNRLGQNWFEVVVEKSSVQRPRISEVMSRKFAVLETDPFSTLVEMSNFDWTR